MRFREQHLHTEYDKLNAKLRDICHVADTLAVFLFEEQLLVTSIWRKKTTDSGLHELYRAIDFRCLQPMERTYRLIDLLNEIYIYDPARPTMKVAHPNPYHGTAPHIHLQVHPNTVSLTPKQVEDFKMRQEVHERNYKPQKL